MGRLYYCFSFISNTKSSAWTLPLPPQKKLSLSRLRMAALLLPASTSLSTLSKNISIRMSFGQPSNCSLGCSSRSRRRRCFPCWHSSARTGIAIR